MLSEELIEKIKHYAGSIKVFESGQGDNVDDAIIERLLDRGVDDIHEYIWSMNTDYIDQLRDNSINDLALAFEDEIVKEVGKHSEGKDIRDILEDEIFLDVVLNLKAIFPPIRVRVELVSDYDVMNSAWLESQALIYNECYFGDAVDALFLNPKKVKDALIRRNYQPIGLWPNLDYRNGRELVYYDEFVTVFMNTATGANHLVILGEMNFDDISEPVKDLTGVVDVANATFGFFDCFNGGGSVLSGTIKYSKTIKVGKNNGNRSWHWRIVGDYGNYNTRDVYGSYPDTVNIEFIKKGK